MMKPLPLFVSGREWGGFFTILALILGINLLIDGIHVSKLNTQVRLETTGVVKKQTHRFTSWGDPYDSLKIVTQEGVTLYVTLPLSSQRLTHHEVEIEAPWKPITLQEFYQGVSLSVVKIKGEALPPTGVAQALRGFIEQQHTSSEMKELFCALFLDDPLSVELQEKVSLFGLAAILSLSGLNVGILSALLFFLLRPLYTFFQDRYFPYRHRQRDLMVVVFLFMVGYLGIVDYTPSFLRAVAMMGVGYVLYARGIDILSFSSLFLVTALLLAFSPSLFFSLGFWLSVAGVYFIYLFLHYWGDMEGWKVYVGLTFWIYGVMLPLIHAIFPLFSLAQLSSPLTSMAYDLFYPLTVVLHVFGWGGVSDGFLTSFLALPALQIPLQTPQWFFYIYGGVALLASRDRVAFSLLNALAGLFFLFAIIGV